MRIGQNPAKSMAFVAQPAKVTVAIVSYIPFLGGYYQEGLEVLKVCLESIWKTTDGPYDLLLFDNASCPEVRHYLQERQSAGKIQYLVLSDRNIGKAGAWNFIFSAAPGEFVAYADSDVCFYPGWLSALMEEFERFPNLGMITGAPMRVPEEFSTSTVAWASNHPEARLQRGVLLTWEDYWKHAHSLGIEMEAEGRQLFEANQDVCLEYQGRRYFIGATHFQFVARRQVLQSVLPLPSQRPMGQVRALDIAINQQGYLRLSTPEWWVQHLGNTLSGSLPQQNDEAKPRRRSAAKGEARQRQLFWRWKPLRKGLIWLYNKTFELLYRNPA
jgi:hypothetical protein